MSGRAAKRRMSPLARRPSGSMTKPDGSTARSAPRLRRQPADTPAPDRTSGACTRAVEREPARALDEPPPPPVEPQPLVQRAHRIVEPRDLFEAAQRSGLREHDEGARVVVKEIPAADGREFAVPEEPDERKLAEV